MRKLGLFLFALLWSSIALADSINIGATPTGLAPTGQIPGTSTNDSAAAGKVGEVLEGTAGFTTISLTSTVASNITSVSLTAGDWEVTCTVQFSPNTTTTISQLNASISTVSATNNLVVGQSAAMQFPSLVLGSGGAHTVQTPPVRISLNSTTTHFCVGSSNFGTSTLTAGGVIHARRVR